MRVFCKYKQFFSFIIKNFIVFMVHYHVIVHSDKQCRCHNFTNVLRILIYCYVPEPTAKYCPSNTAILKQDLAQNLLISSHFYGICFKDIC
jgi:hypothetical protein